LLIKNANVIAGEKILEGYAVYCENGKIVQVRKDSGDMSADEVVDAGGKYIAPGFIDLHMHGAHDISAESSKRGLEELLTIMPRYGVTAMLAGVCPHKSDEAEIERLEEFSEIESEGTELLGFFLEGHFLTLFGAIAYIPEDRSKKRVVALKKAASPKRIAFAISPELDGIIELLPEMVKDGYPAFITHTGATHEQTEAAIILIRLNMRFLQQPALARAMMHNDSKLALFLIQRLRKIGRFLIQRMRPIVPASPKPILRHFTVKIIKSILRYPVPILGHSRFATLFLKILKQLTISRYKLCARNHLPASFL